ncbi:MAG: hypothetical protein IJ689_01915 [Alphaproteobacteria bacterium]|nr:hypothetical protein [Alphaproteobacteria bacterium]
MNKYILLLGIAAVSIGSYCAYAGNSATMTVTATIAHDVSLSVTEDITISAVVNPAVTSVSETWCVAGDNIANGQGCTAYSGLFTATVPDGYDGFTISPSELTHDTLRIHDFNCGPTGRPNEFDIGYSLTYSGGAPSDGDHDFGNITITYNP